MSSLLRKLRNLSGKDKDRSRSSSPAPSASRPSTSGESAINIDLVTGPIRHGPNENKKLYLAAGIAALQHLKEINEASDFLGPLKAAYGATTAILEMIKAMDSKKEPWKSTLQAIQRHRRTFEQQLTGMNAQLVPLDVEPGLLEPIKAYGQVLKSILGAFMLENEISTQVIPYEPKSQSLATFMKRYGTVKVEADKISGYVDELDAAMKQFTTSLAVYTSFKLHQIEQKLVVIDTKLNIVAPKVKLKPRPRLVPHFIGREDILEAMHRAHFENHQAGQQVITVLSGIGGLGKTQIALKFALEVEERYPDVHVYLLDASSAEKLQNDLEILIRSHGTAYHTNSYEDALVWLATELKNWLIILDNVDDPSMDPVHYIPQCAHGHVIVTTRNATLSKLAPNTSYALDGLSTDDAITLLLTASKYLGTQENRESAEKIVQELGYLPLALSHAASFIFVHRCLGSYLDMYRKNREKILASVKQRLLVNYRPSVATTIEMSLGKLSERAQDIMRLLSHLHVTSIPHSMIVTAAERRFRRVEWTEASSLSLETLKQADVLGKIFCPSGEWSEFDFNEAIFECLQYSLLQLITQDDGKFYSIHVLVQSYLQGYGFIHDHQPKRLVGRLLGSAVTIGKRYEFLAFNRHLLPHIQLVQIEDVTEAGDHYSLGYVLHEVGYARLARLHQEKCVEIWTQLLGKEDEHTTAAMEYLAISYKEIGNSQAALGLDEEVLSLRKRLLGPENPETLRAMGNLAISYKNMGKNQAALELEEEVLSLQKKLLGPEHLDTVHTMGNLAVSYSNVGKNQVALGLEEEVLSLRRRLLGPEHPDTVRTIGSLAVSYSQVGKNQEALKLQEEVLALRKRLLGPEHPDTMHTMGNLAISYSQAGENKAALELQEQVLSLQRRRLGPEHPDTVHTMGNLVISYTNLGKNQAAMELEEEVLLLQRKLFGPEHPVTMQTMGNLAVSYKNMGKNRAALELEEVLSWQTRSTVRPNELQRDQDQSPPEYVPNKLDEDAELSNTIGTSIPQLIKFLEDRRKSLAQSAAASALTTAADHSKLLIQDTSASTSSQGNILSSVMPESLKMGFGSEEALGTISVGGQTDSDYIESRKILNGVCIHTSTRPTIGAQFLNSPPSWDAIGMGNRETITEEHRTTSARCKEFIRDCWGIEMLDTKVPFSLTDIESRNMASANQGVVTYFTVTQSFIRAKLIFDKPTIRTLLREEVKISIEKALSDEEEGVSSLNDIFDNWGHGFPGEIVLGGQRQLFTEALNVNSETAAYIEECLRNQIRGIRIDDQSIYALKWSKDQKDAWQNAMERTSERFIGGDSAYRDPNRWEESLEFVPNWNVIKRDKLVPLVDLLPDNQRTAIFQIAPKPLIGRWIPGDQLITQTCESFRVYEPYLSEEDLKEGWFSLGQSLNRSLALIIKEASDLSHYTRPALSATLQWCAKHEYEDSELLSDHESQQSSERSEIEQRHLDSLYSVNTNDDDYISLGSYFTSALQEDSPSVRLGHDAIRSLRIIRRDLLAVAKYSDKTALETESGTIRTILPEIDSDSIGLAMFFASNNATQPQQYPRVLRRDAIQILNPEREETTNSSKYRSK